MNKKNTIVCGNNIEWMEEIPDQSIDLCYIDPPFFSNKNYEIVWGNSYEKRSFGDRFEGGILHYVEWMKERIVLIHKKLKKTGSFYLHCDWHASHYLKIICDDVFGYKNFRNEIVWHYENRLSRKGKPFPKLHDIIFIYSKTNQFTSNHIPIPNWQPKGGHSYSVQKGYSLRKRELAIYDSSKKAEILKKIDPSKYDKVKYKDISDSPSLGDVWEMPFINPMAKERIGYKTQKPEALLERIIKASSNKGDFVLDCFAGGGTTAKVCADLERNFICGDVSPVAVRVIANRLNKYCPKVNYEVVGLPKTEKELKSISGHNFADLVCRCKGWDANEKKSSDGGIDGWANNKKIPIQIKNHTKPVGEPDIRNFAGAMLNKKSEEGIFVAWKFSKKAIEYIASIKKEQNKIIKIVKCDDIFRDILISENKQKKLKDYYSRRVTKQLDLEL